MCEVTRMTTRTTAVEPSPGLAGVRTMTGLPAIVIGAPRSGEGKTTVALGIMAALRKRGLCVQGFKVGPDYLDTGYQCFATGRPGRNLDLWMMGREAVERAVEGQRDLVDVVVIEGVMGLFDGHRDGATPTSTADVAVTLGAPVILVIDAAHTAASLGALALGFRTYDPQVDVAGVILNRWAIHRDRRAVQEALVRAGVEPFGYLPSGPDVALPSRHLGLVSAGESGEETAAVMNRLAVLVESHVDLDGLLRLVSERCAAPNRAIRSDEEPVAVPPTLTAVTPPRGPRPRVAVALDSAFAFYYQDNLDALKQAGADLVTFSPLIAEALPSCDGLYLGGGYPELYAGILSANQALRENIRAAIAAGLPTYAECGGLLYLSEMIEDLEAKPWPFVGAVPGRAIMHERLQSVGYREGILARDCLLGRAGDRLRGHEFHYSSCSIDRQRSPGCGPAYTIDGNPEGYACGQLFASYIHLHFAGCPQVVDRWLDRCSAYAAGHGRRGLNQRSEGDR